MAILRSQRNTKITFTEDGELPGNPETVSVSTREETREARAEESDSDSDEAPEEQSTSKAKEDLLAKAKAEQDMQREALKMAKEKRRLRDLQFKTQQEEKRKKERQEKALQAQRLEQQRREQQRLEASAQSEVLPELLPEELLGGAAFTNEKKVSKHIRSDEFEAEHAAMRKKMKLEKLRALKEKSAVKKGSIYVQVQEFNSGKSRVPKAEQRILDEKSKWMQRESLNKKA